MIKDLFINGNACGVYVVNNVSCGVSKTGQGFLNVTLQDKTGINVMIAEDAISCVALGTGKALDNLDALDGNIR